MPSLPLDTPGALFDVTRLLRGRMRRTPTGVDRIDLAIGLDLARRLGPDCRFVHAAAAGPALIPADVGAALLHDLARWWRGEAAAPPRPSAALLRDLARGWARGWLGGFQAQADDRTTYVNASHSGLPLAPSGLERIDPGRRMRRAAYLHDLIPLEHPEYQRPRSVRRFERFLAALTTAPIRLFANSLDTARRTDALAKARGWPTASATALPPRVPPPPTTAADDPRLRPAVRALLAEARPHFVVLGTIEPRKNHLLLLHLWRVFAGEDATPPRLVVIGRRGWENEMVVDMLDRCPALRPHVTELGDLSDLETGTLLASARALLFPSFAEGLGLPLLEAAALGVPVIVSDIAVFREFAPADATLLDPLDGPAWRAAIMARAP